MKKLYTLLLVGTFTFIGYSQTIVSDSQGNDMYNYYTGNKLSLELETGKEEINVNYNLPVYKSFYYYKRDVPAVPATETTPGAAAYVAKDTTITTSHDLQIGLKLLNSNGAIDYNQLGNNRIGFEFTLGYQRSVDKIVDMAALTKNHEVFWAFGGSFFVKRENILLYDPAVSKESEEFPVSTGFNFNIAAYRWIICATQFSGTVGFKRWNTDDLDTFYANTPVLSNGDIIAFDTEPKGKYGTLESDSFLQLRFANPFFPFPKGVVKTDWSVLSKIAITPYVTGEYAKKLTPEYRYGLMVNILANSIDLNHSYVIEKGFGIGVDKSNNDNNPVLFLRGTFSFGEITKHDSDSGNAKN